MANASDSMVVFNPNSILDYHETELSPHRNFVRASSAVSYRRKQKPLSLASQNERPHDARLPGQRQQQRPENPTLPYYQRYYSMSQPQMDRGGWQAMHHQNSASDQRHAQKVPTGPRQPHDHWSPFSPRHRNGNGRRKAQWREKNLPQVLNTLSEDCQKRIESHDPRAGSIELGETPTFRQPLEKSENTTSCKPWEDYPKRSTTPVSSHELPSSIPVCTTSIAEPPPTDETQLNTSSQERTPKQLCAHTELTPDMQRWLKYTGFEDVELRRNIFAMADQLEAAFKGLPSSVTNIRITRPTKEITIPSALGDETSVVAAEATAGYLNPLSGLESHVSQTVDRSGSRVPGRLEVQIPVSSPHQATTDQIEVDTEADCLPKPKLKKKKKATVTF